MSGQDLSFFFFRKRSLHSDFPLSIIHILWIWLLRMCTLYCVLCTVCQLQNTMVCWGRNNENQSTVPQVVIYLHTHTCMGVRMHTHTHAHMYTSILLCLSISATGPRTRESWRKKSSTTRWLPHRHRRHRAHRACAHHRQKKNRNYSL